MVEKPRDARNKKLARDVTIFSNDGGPGEMVEITEKIKRIYGSSITSFLCLLTED